MVEVYNRVSKSTMMLAETGECAILKVFLIIAVCISDNSCWLKMWEFLCEILFNYHCKNRQDKMSFIMEMNLETRYGYYSSSVRPPMGNAAPHML